MRHVPSTETTEKDLCKLSEKDDNMIEDRENVEDNASDTFDKLMGWGSEKVSVVHNEEASVEHLTCFKNI